MKLRNRINNGVVTVGPEFGKKLIQGGSWVEEGGSRSKPAAKKPATKKAAAKEKED